MGKKILIGSMLVLTLLLLMPSIPAIQQKTVEDKAYSDLLEQLKDVDFKDLKDVISNGDSAKYPLMFLLIFSLIRIKVIRGFRLMMESSNYPYNEIFGDPLEIYNPIIYYRGLWLMETASLRRTIWSGLSEELGWNWDFSNPWWEKQ